MRPSHAMIAYLPLARGHKPGDPSAPTCRRGLTALAAKVHHGLRAPPLRLGASPLARAAIARPHLSQAAPSAAVMLAELALQAGVPNGVLNVVHGGEPTVDLLVTHPGEASGAEERAQLLVHFGWERCAEGMRESAFHTRCSCCFLPFLLVDEGRGVCGSF